MADLRTVSPIRSGRRLPKLVSILLTGVVVGGCGSSASSNQTGGSSTTTASTVSQAVALKVAFPPKTYVTHASSILVRGSGAPHDDIAATSDVGSTQAATASSSGSWKIRIRLKVGRNYISLSGTGSSGLVGVAVTRKQTAAQAAAAREAAAARAAAAKQAKEARAAAAKQAKAARAAAAQQAFINSARTIPYTQLIKDSTPYVGEKIALHGQIFQIQQQQGQGGIMLLSVTDQGYGIWTDNVWVDYDKDISYVEKNIVNVYGTVTGTKSYQTQSGGTTYVPEVHAKYITSG